MDLLRQQGTFLFRRAWKTQLTLLVARRSEGTRRLGTLYSSTQMVPRC
jgi:hypothetical protein